MNNSEIIEGMAKGYLECQLWAGLDMGDYDDADTMRPLDDNYSRSDIADEYVDSMREEFAALVAAHPLAVRMYLNRVTVMGNMRNTPEQFGHDYYLTREHHGTGFWDRGLGELGDYLTDIAEGAGSAEQLWDNGNGKLSA